MSLEQTLAALYKSEINIQIKWCWDGGIELAIIDGYDGSSYVWTTVKTIEEIEPWLTQAAIQLYPKSQFATTKGE